MFEERVKWVLCLQSRGLTRVNDLYTNAFRFHICHQEVRYSLEGRNTRKIVSQGSQWFEVNAGHAIQTNRRVKVMMMMTVYSRMFRTAVVIIVWDVGRVSWVAIVVIVMTCQRRWVVVAWRSYRISSLRNNGADGTIWRTAWREMSRSWWSTIRVSTGCSSLLLIQPLLLPKLSSSILEPDLKAETRQQKIQA